MSVSRFVYFAERDGLIKIGCSGDPKERARKQHANLLKVRPGGFADEKVEHARFAESRVDGEWFKPSPELLAHIEALTLPAPVRSWPSPRSVPIGIAAAELGVSKATVSRLCDTGELTYWKTPGGTRRVFMDDRHEGVA